jgi:predicted PurR-regulated permease PerM
MTLPVLSPVETPDLVWQRRRTLATERIFYGLATLFGITFAIAMVWTLADVVLLVFAAALLACLLRGGAEALAKRCGGPPTLWLALIIVGLLGSIGLVLWLRGPFLAGEVSQVWKQLTEQAKAIWGKFGEADWLQPLVSRLKGYVEEGTQKIAGMAAGFATSTLGGLGSLVVLLVAAVYFAIDPDLYVAGTLKLLPKGWRPRGGEVMSEMAQVLRWWFVGQFLDMVAVGLMTGIGLYLLGVKLAVTLGIIAALFNFVPYIGALAGAVPAVMVALGAGPQTALYVAALFIVVQALEGNVIAPLVQKQTVELAPVLTIFAQTVLGTLFGPLGLILATPLTAAGVVAVRMVYIESVLGDGVDEKDLPQSS